MKKTITLACCVACGLTLFNSLVGCKANELPNPEVPTLCDSISATYNDTVKSILDSKCAVSGCHLNSQSPFLTNFTEVSSSANRIGVRALDLQTMPPLGMPALTDEEKAILNCWRNAGFPEN